MQDKFLFHTETDWVPHFWYLHECLTWIALSKIPWGYSAGKHAIESFSHDKIYELGPELSKTHLMHLDREYTDEANISPSPMYGEFENTHVDRLIEDLSEHKEFLKKHDFDTDYTEERIASIEDFLFTRSKWLEELNSFLDIARTKLFLALREGKLKARGIPIPAKSLEGAKSYIKKHSTRYSLEKKVVVPAENWMLDKTRWNDGTLTTEGVFYCCIGINRQELLSVFRPEYESAIKGGHIDGLIVTNENDGAPENLRNDKADNTKKAGRPSKNWDAFHLELARRIQKNQLHQKQSATIAEMQI